MEVQVLLDEHCAKLCLLLWRDANTMLILILLEVVLVKRFNFVPILLLVITIVLEAVGEYL